jgi:hypothetical protein
MNIAAQVTITRTNGGDESKPISIYIRDADARVEFVAVRMSLEAFAEAVMGLAGVDAVAQIKNIEKVGKVCEHKNESIDISDGEGNGLLRMKEHEVDGWVGRASDLSNRHYQTRKDGRTFASVGFNRWVEKP